MTAAQIIGLVVWMALLLGLAWPLGRYMARVYEGQRVFLTPVVAPIERLTYRLLRVDPEAGMGWRAYAGSMLLFNAAGLLAVYAFVRLQGLLPLNPQGFRPMDADLAFNTAVSFASNTNWQAYGGEATLSYLSQMAALTVQNFVSAATGMAVVVALIRGLRARAGGNLGSFWVDLTRSVLYILLPLSMVVALVLISQGVIQNLAPYTPTALLDPSAGAGQLLPQGPAAAQIAIKQLGTNGGGFFNVNSAHPFENPTPVSNLVESLSILIIPAALCFTFGRMLGDRRQGRAVLAAMTIVFVVMLFSATALEQGGNPLLTGAGADQVASATQSGGNLEGKEVRFGAVDSALWATATTAASNGSVNSMHDSYTPLGGLVPLFLMQLGEVIYGGVGSGLYGMVVFIIVAVFVAGLMVGRTPEYLGKKIGQFEMKMTMIAVLAPPLAVLIGAGISAVVPTGAEAVTNPGPHGFSEILYAFSSMGNNNGSAFAGFAADNPLINTVGGLAMLVARYWVAVPVLAIAGSLAGKRRVAPGLGTLPTHTPLFVALLIGTVMIVGALTFLPALALGPIVEQLLLAGMR